MRRVPFLARRSETRATSDGLHFAERLAIATFLSRTRRVLLPGGARTRWRNVVCCMDYSFRNQIRDSDPVHPCADSFVM